MYKKTTIKTLKDTFSCKIAILLSKLKEIIREK